MKTIKIKVEYAGHREDMVMALASNDYKVWIEKYPQGGTSTDYDYFVCFEYRE